MTLLACSLVLFGVALLASASLRSQQDSISLTYSIIDRLLAQHAAESALRDAAMSLTMMQRNGVIVQAQGLHHFGDITGEHFPYGSPGQSCAVPEYFLELLSQPAGADTTQNKVSDSCRYRVTATGKGLSQATTVTLQAEFEAQMCNVTQDSGEKENQSNPRKSMGSGAQKDEQAAGQRDAGCIPNVRRVTWRLLRAT